MRTFFATFPAGLDALVTRFVEQDFDHLSVHSTFENALICTSALGDSAVSQCPYFHNVFTIIDRFCGNMRGELASAITYFTRKLDSYDLRRQIRPFKSFRIVISDENKLISIDSALRRSLEQKVSRIIGTPIDNKDPGAELWIARRREGEVLLMRKLFSRRKRTAPAGALHAELGSILCRLSEPSGDDVFLDPFCGHGGIFLQRLTWKYRMAFALDKNPECIESVKQSLQKRNPKWRKRTYVKFGDGTRLNDFRDGFVTAIATDPPWGSYDRTIDLEDVYSRVCREASRVLSHDGVFVLLAGRSLQIDRFLDRSSPGLTVVESHDLLVSGKKATVWRIVKR